MLQVIVWQQRCYNHDELMNCVTNSDTVYLDEHKHHNIIQPLPPTDSAARL